MTNLQLKPETIGFLQDRIDRTLTALHEVEKLVANDRLTKLPELADASLGLCQGIMLALEGDA